MNRPDSNNNDKETHIQRLTELKKSVDTWIDFQEANSKKELTDRLIKLDVILKKAIEAKAIELFYGTEFWEYHEKLTSQEKTDKTVH